MLDMIKDAVTRAFRQNQLSWLLSAVTDWSYEEGNAPAFAKYVKLFEDSGTPITLSSRMRLGVNGYLEEALKASSLTVTARRRTNGFDFSVSSNLGETADIESKLSYDCTMPKYYKEIAQDRVKLIADASASGLYQVVFLVSLPAYSYPAGEWSRKQFKARQTVYLGIADQWNAIQGQPGMKVPTVWDDGGPLIFQFDPHIVSSADSYLKRFFNSNFRPSTNWAIDPSRHFAGAAVGIALWKWR